MYKILFLLFLFACHFNESILVGNEQSMTKEESRIQESKMIERLSAEYAKFYAMAPDAEFRDITEELLESPLVKDPQKQAIRNFNRKILVFTYPSDGLKIKGLISFVPSAENQPLLVLLRGGNRTFAILNPGGDLMTLEQYTVIATMYRGGVSEGEDEFGGDDVNDVNNLIQFIPQLEDKLGLNLQSQKMFMIGGSRGGMQMFLALGRFPELQTRFEKIVSISGLLDMRECFVSRPVMKEMFVNDFGLIEGVNDEEWINKRDPLLMAEHIMVDLPILIIQGTDDNRTTLKNGYNMVSRLQAAGCNVTYWEIDGGNHCIANKPNRAQLILKWLQE